MRAFFLTLTVAILVLNGWAQATKEAPLNDNDQIRFVALSVILTPWTSDSADVAAICVSVERKHPGNALLAKLKELSVRVKPKSGCYLDRKSLARERKTGKKSVILEVVDLKKLSADEAELRGGSYVGNMGADGCTYRLRRENGTWLIAAKEACYIS